MATRSSATEIQENPLLEGLEVRRRPEPCVLAIFGASGDLTRRKIFPALYALAFRDLLPEQFAVVGVARTSNGRRGVRRGDGGGGARVRRDEFRQDVWDRLAANTRYVSIDFADEESQDQVVRTLLELDEDVGSRGNRVFYFAVPPDAMPRLVEALGKRRTRAGWKRLIVEKPFGHDLVSAKKLNELLAGDFAEDEVFRIDHYLGKDTVQNLLALRFANGIFEPVWNRQFIDHVQITVGESIGIGSRAAFYEQAGAIRDVFQNHLLQLVALTGMEPPIDFTAEAVRNEKLKVLKALATPAPNEFVRGQYGPGLHRGPAGAGLPRGAWGQPRVGDRDLRRSEARDRELALGGHAVLRPRRQAAPTPRDDDRDPVQARSPSALRGRERVAAEHPDHPHPAQRGRVARDGAKVPGEGMRVRTVHMDFLYGGAFRTGLPEA